MQGGLEEFCWAPIIDVLADGGGKVKDDILAAKLLKDGAWYPSGYKILFRANMDGADSVDRLRRPQDEDIEEVTPVGTFSWFFGCTGVAHVASGCEGTCPWCTGSHYESVEDQIPLTFWTA